MAEEISTKSKIECRAEALARMKGLMDSSIEEAQANLDLQLSAFLKNYRGSWGGYWPMTGEASPLSSIAQSTHIRWAYPRVSGETLDFYFDPKVWVKGQFGIEEPEPSQSEPANLQALYGYLIPGLAFDRQGTRLGRGWGFFDRALEHYKGLRVGVTFEALVFDSALPRESHDVPVDILVTDRGVMFINPKGDR